MLTTTARATTLAQPRRRVLFAATAPALLLALLLALLPAAMPSGGTLARAQSATPVLSLPDVPTLDLAGVQPRPVDAAMLAALDAYASDAAERYGIIGASWAIAANGDVAGSGAYGLREIDGSAPVTPDTRFMIGSVTKSLTSLMAATVVDDGRASWDTPLAALIPGFALADPALAARVTLADSFCACTGLPRDDIPLILDPPAAPSDMLAQLAGIDPVTPFGDAFNYSNQLYAAGGFAATLATSGTIPTLARDYDLAMQSRVLNPIGMTASTFRLEDVLDSRNYAAPHGVTISGDTVTIPLLAEDHFVGNIAPAGALWSTAPDMARYLATQLNDGIAPGGARVVSPENLAVTHGQRIDMGSSVSAGAPPLIANTFGGYALGWVLGTWNGLPIMSHAGGTLGFTSEVAMLPDAGVGIVILTNGGNTAGLFNMAVQFRLFELLYGLDPQAAPLTDQLVTLTRTATDAIAAGLPAIEPDPAAIAPFVGSYQRPGLGVIRLSLENGAPILTAGTMRTRLLPAPPAADTDPAATPEPGDPGQRFLLVDPPLGSPDVSITLRQTADGPELRLETVEEQPHSYIFTRVP